MCGSLVLRNQRMLIPREIGRIDQVTVGEGPMVPARQTPAIAQLQRSSSAQPSSEIRRGGHGGTPAAALRSVTPEVWGSACDLLRENKKFEMSLPEVFDIVLLCAQTWCGHIGRHIFICISLRLLISIQEIRAVHILRHSLHHDLKLRLDSGQHQRCPLDWRRQGVRRRKRGRTMLVDQDWRAPLAMARQR